MSRFALNIAALTSPRTNATGQKCVISHGRMVKALQEGGFHVRLTAATEGQDEPGWTVIVTDEQPLSISSAHERFECVSEELMQDCIAIVPLEHTTRDGVPCWQPRWSLGRLIGPQSEAWGAFDQSFFTLPPL